VSGGALWRRESGQGRGGGRGALDELPGAGARKRRLVISALKEKGWRWVRGGKKREEKEDPDLLDTFLVDGRRNTQALIA